MVRITQGETGGVEEDEPQSLIEAISEAESDEETNEFILMIREMINPQSESSTYDIDFPSLK